MTNPNVETSDNAAKQVENAVNNAAVVSLLSGEWMTGEVKETLRAEAEEFIMQRVMAGLTPDLRTLMADRRTQLRAVVIAGFHDSIVALYLTPST